MCGIVVLTLGGGGDDGNDAAADASAALSPFLPSLQRRGPDALGHALVPLSTGRLLIASSLLQVRGRGEDANGSEAARAPASPLVLGRGDGSDGDSTTPTTPISIVLAYNGEVYESDRLDFAGKTDGEALLAALGAAPGGDAGSEEEVASVLSSLRGPWAVVLWHGPSRRLFFGRDLFGRRSLLVRRQGGFALASVAPPPLAASSPSSNNDGEWSELPPGIWSVGEEQLTKDQSQDPTSPDAWRPHPWTDPLLERLSAYDRSATASSLPPQPLASWRRYAPLVLDTLLRAIARLCAPETLARWHASLETLPEAGMQAQGGCCNPSLVLLSPPSPVLVLLSGGVDSMLLAACGHLCLPAGVPIDLCNVCFDAQGGHRSPDRVAALEGASALRRWAGPSRPFRLILVDATLEDVDAVQDRLRALMAPQSTVMDLNIGAALWLAARGVGRLQEEQEDGGGTSSPPPHLVASAARVVLLGHGADEQHAGYGRHRTSWRAGGHAGLAAELAVDVKRLWRRNLGRDDRLVADVSREARHPFLDEEFASAACLDVPVEALVGFGQEEEEEKGVPPDKRLLRRALLLLGRRRGGGGGGGGGEGGDGEEEDEEDQDNPFAAAARREKRAIQFGTRLAKAMNVREFGSNRKANAQKVGTQDLSRMTGGGFGGGGGGDGGDGREGTSR
jgi:asparagine synthetase B (glutamine-hydrolysing)